MPHNVAEMLAIWFFVMVGAVLFLGMVFAMLVWGTMQVRVRNVKRHRASKEAKKAVTRDSWSA